MHYQPAVGTPGAIRGGRAARADRPATAAAGRLARAEFLLGALGLGSVGFVFLRLAETWHVTPSNAARRISVLGERLSYPAANLAAVIVLALALLGMVATAGAVIAVWAEARAARRFGRAIRGVSAEGGSMLHGALLFHDDLPQAFCAGLLKPRVYVSTGAMATLDEAALQAVLRHERHHARRRDPLRLAAGRVFTRAFFFVPGLRELVRHHQELAELSADESALRGAPSDRSALARAILGFSDGSSGVDASRVDQVLGEPVSWKLPLLLYLIPLAAFVALTAAAALLGQWANGSLTLAPPLLSRQPCVVAVATVPALVALTAAGLLRGEGRRR